MKTPGPRFGSHMSAAGGLENAFTAGHDAGCQSLQLFVKNQRQWAAPPLTADQIERYRKAAEASPLRPVVAHASYLINLASPDPDTRLKSSRALADEHQRCGQLGIPYLVLHPGAALDQPRSNAVQKVAQALDHILDRQPDNPCTILLENTAGQGSTLGHRFEELADILHHADNRQRLGTCIDTCHLFAAGYDFRKPEDYASIIRELDSAITVASVKCIHANDSKREAGSRVDRHEHIGKGKIGTRGFAHFVNDPRWNDLPFILETPKGKDARGADLDKVNLNKLRKLLKKTPAKT